jgi:hypothetical protein
MPRRFSIPGFVVLVIAALLAPAAVRSAPAERTLLPVDEAASRPDFFTFRAALMVTIARRDAGALLAVVHPDIKSSFGGDEGKASFEALWKPAAPDSRVWETLGAVLALGGTFQEADSFVAPYTFSRWPSDVDAFEHMAVVGDRVRIRRAARADAPAIGSSSFGILPVARDGQAVDEAWTAVRMADGTVGHIATRYVRSPIDYRAEFGKQDGRWMMRMFLAGD